MEGETSYAKAGDLDIAYRVVGDGPIDLVFVPGIISHLDLFFTVDHFVAMAERLASFARVVFFDKRGTGLSDPTPAAAELDERMDDVRAVMDAVGMERAAILGLSEGGPMSVLFAATFPERVQALVLCGTFGRLPLGTPAHTVLREGVDHWGDARLASALAPSMELNIVLRKMAGFIERASASPQMARSLFACIEHIDVRSILPAIQVPTLVVHRRNEAIPLELAQELADGIPNAKLVVVEGDDHMPWLGDHEAYFGPIEEFLTGSRHQATVDRALGTVLFTDIVDSTKRNASVGDDEWRRVLERHNDVARAAIAEYRGREVKTIGDGFLAVFDGPARAIRCANEIVATAAEIGVVVRAGVHTGEMETYSNGDVGGMAVNIGARVGDAAEGGEVLVSSTVRDLVYGSGFRFEPRGERELKGVPGRWSLFALTGEGPDENAPPLAASDHFGPLDRTRVRLAAKYPGALRRFGRLVTPKDVATPSPRRKPSNV